MNLAQASVWNVGTSDFDVKGEIQVKNHKDESTEAKSRDGMTHSSEEAPVMGVEQRGHVIRFWTKDNRKGGTNGQNKVL